MTKPSQAKRTKLTKPIESSDEEDIPSTPQVASKKTNKTTVVESKAVSRLRRIVDSDSEDGITFLLILTIYIENKIYFIYIVETPPPKNEPSNNNVPKRRKAKRTVTRMYQDESGYMSNYIYITNIICIF